MIQMDHIWQYIAFSISNFSEILSGIHIVSFYKMHLKMSSGKWQPFCLGLGGLIFQAYVTVICKSDYLQCEPTIAGTTGDRAFNILWTMTDAIAVILTTCHPSISYANSAV